MHRAELALAGAVLLATALVTALAMAALPSSQSLVQLPPALQRQLQARETAWQALGPAQRQALRARIAAWDALPLAQRRERRERWQAWQALPVAERLQLRTAAAAFAALLPAQQTALQASFAALDGSIRHGWLLGPTLGADYAQLQPLLQQVPALEREPLLNALRSMTAGERLDLAMLAQRTAPPQRDELRRQLLSTSAANRADWLRQRLER